MKEELRHLFKARLREIPTSQREEAEKKLLTLPLPKKGFILSFASLPHEISTRLLNERLALEGRLLLPRIEGKQLKAYQVQSLNDLVPGPFKLLEPKPLLPAEPAFILVPGLAFDDLHHRVGYGKGFYDRFLALYPHTPTLGVGFTQQKVKALPVAPHDICLNTSCFF